MKIYKYELHILGINRVKTHQHSVPLSVGLDPKGILCIWMLVNPEFAEYVLPVHVCFTGDDAPFSTSSRFVGTVKGSKDLMYHVFA